MPLPRWISTVAAVSMMLVGGAVVPAAAAETSDLSTATVERIIDGDTLEVTASGATHRVRLLNVNTPETVHPGRDVECLGHEATEFLEALLAPGDEVRLEFDLVRTDRYGRLLAGVYAGDVLINAEIARAGLGTVEFYAPNVRFLPTVWLAQAEAEADQLGLFSDNEECTLPAQLNAAVDQLAAWEEPLPSEIDDLESLIAAGPGMVESLATVAALASGSSAAESILPILRFETATRLLSLRDIVSDGSQVVEQQVEAAEQELEVLHEAVAEAERIAVEEAAEAERQAEQARITEAERVAESERVAEAERQRQAQVPSPAPEAPREPEPAPAPTQATAPSQPAAPQPSAPTQQENSERDRDRDRDRNGGVGTPNLGPDAPPPGYFHKEHPTSYTGPRCFLPGGNYWQPC